MTKFLFVLCFAALICTVLTMPPGSYDSRWYRNDWRYNDMHMANRRYYDELNTMNQWKNPAASARIWRMDTVPHEADGTYAYAYETENGIKAEERGIPYDLGTRGRKGGVEGSYSYTSPEGLHVFVRYIADETGFHPYITYDGPGANALAKNAQSADVSISTTDKQKSSQWNLNNSKWQGPAIS